MKKKEDPDAARDAALLLRLTAATLRMLRSVDLMDALPAPPLPPPSGDDDAAARAMMLTAQAAHGAWDAARAAGAATLPDGVAQLFDGLADALERAAWVMDVDDVRDRGDGGDGALWTAVAAHARARLRQACADLRAVGGPAAAPAAALADDLERIGAGR